MSRVAVLRKCCVSCRSRRRRVQAPRRAATWILRRARQMGQWADGPERVVVGAPGSRIGPGSRSAHRELLGRLRLRDSEGRLVRLVALGEDDSGQAELVWEHV